MEVPNGSEKVEIEQPQARPSDENKQVEKTTGPWRTKSVFIRTEDGVHAMDPFQRIQVQVKAFFRQICCRLPKEGARTEYPGRKKDDEIRPSPQYRLQAFHKARTTGFIGKLASCCCGRAVGSGMSGIGINHNQRLASSLHWMFRVNFLFLFGFMCTIFFVWVMIFAGFIVLAGLMDNQCVRVGGDPFSDAAPRFADAFSLSWTTFSTVGYGSTYPALGHENENPTNCLFITIICSLESFLGVLYSGFCGAILFGKVLRIQSHAQVIFSDPIVIRYGSGVEQTSEDIDEEENTGKKIPCPVLEFRVVNRLFAETGGEIMDATLNCVANVDADDTDPSLEADYKTCSLPGNKSDSPSRVASTIDSMSDNRSDSRQKSCDSGKNRGTTSFLENIIVRRNHRALDEDSSARLVNKRIFSKMVIESGEHPFFKRVWLARHVLDDTSPILKPKVRSHIRRNDGYWPERWNNCDAVRDSLQFNQILVSLNGVSNVSASDVYAQKIYDFVDINVGYQFANLLYKDSDGALKVDTDLINDVTEQRGPDSGEPLILASD